MTWTIRAFAGTYIQVLHSAKLFHRAPQDDQTCVGILKGAHTHADHSGSTPSGSGRIKSRGASRLSLVSGWNLGATLLSVPPIAGTEQSPVNNPTAAHGPGGLIMYVTDWSIMCSSNYGANWTSLDPTSFENQVAGSFLGKQDVLYDEVYGKFIHTMQFSRAVLLVMWADRNLCQSQVWML